MRSKAALKDTPHRDIFIAKPQSKGKQYIEYMKRRYAREKSDGAEGRLIVSRANGKFGRVEGGKPNWSITVNGFRPWLQARRAEQPSATTAKPPATTAKPPAATLQPSGATTEASEATAEPPTEATPDPSATTPESDTDIHDLSAMHDSFMSAREDESTPTLPSPAPSTPSQDVSDLPEHKRSSRKAATEEDGGKGPATGAKGGQPLNILCFNARNMASNFSEFRQHCTDEKIHAALINETWLTEAFPDNLLSMEGRYSVFRQDRSDGRRRGGVAILIAAEMQTVAVQSPASDHRVEIQAADVFLPQGTLRLVSAYRPPDASLDHTIALCKAVSALAESAKGEIFVYSDINLPGLDWEKAEVSTPAEEIVWDTFEIKLGLTQAVDRPTRRNAATGKWSLLDTVLTSHPDNIASLRVTPPIGNSDHMSISVKHLSSVTESRKDRRLNWRKADWDCMQDALDEVGCWGFSVDDDQSVEQCAKHFYDIVSTLVKDCAMLSAKTF